MDNTNTEREPKDKDLKLLKSETQPRISFYPKISEVDNATFETKKDWIEKLIKWHIKCPSH